MATKQNDPLESFFEAANDARPEVDASLNRRILGDADTVLTDAARQASRRNSPFVRFLETLGGWPAMAGLATATVAGIWIGISPPDMIETLITVQTVDYLPGFDALLEEG